MCLEGMLQCRCWRVSLFWSLLLAPGSLLIPDHPDSYQHQHHVFNVTNAIMSSTSTSRGRGGVGVVASLQAPKSVLFPSCFVFGERGGGWLSSILQAMTESSEGRTAAFLGQITEEAMINDFQLTWQSTVKTVVQQMCGLSNTFGNAANALVVRVSIETFP